MDNVLGRLFFNFCRLDDEMKFLSRNFDVDRYTYPEFARNRMAYLLNMDVQRTYLKKTRYFLKYVMEDSELNCLFYKIYSDSTVMEKVCAQLKCMYSVHNCNMI